MASKKMTLDIEVNTSKIKEAKRSAADIESLSKDILKSNKELLKSVQDILKKLSLAVKERKSETSELEKQRRSLERIKSLEADRYKEYQRAKARKDLESAIERRELEKPKMGFLERVQKYKGASGGFLAFGEKAAEAKQAEIDEADAEILQKTQAREDAAAALERAKAARLSAKGKKAISAADAAVAKGYADLEAADQGVRDSQEKKSKLVGEQRTSIAKYQALSRAATHLDRALESAGKAVLGFVTKPLKELASGATEAAKAMLDFKTGAATYSASSSLITNAEAREQQLKYGLTAAQNYAFTQAKSMLNIQSDEDLMYMNAGQRDRLLSYMERYSDWYSELESSGVLASIQEMQLEFAELKQELAMEFLQWIAENKDAIMSVIKGMFEFLKVIANAVLSIMTLFGGQSQDLYAASDVSDRVTSNTNNSRTTNVTVNANTTNNATGVLGSQEAFDRFSDENWSKLAKQVVEAVGG